MATRISIVWTELQKGKYRIENKSSLAIYPYQMAGLPEFKPENV
jgi:hypothetical protein